ncbi:ribosomal protein L28e [Cladophialophora yegresii CBS 114405]|uniref:Ribosomal protein L28e n=1 Tax=Cladophialophora yegresii CBS 114405 TaxID=1182544 RepID=W9W432_9EURO|nr:ribosomal protein L28e [Cladophialophora yegresii CBS 114405]EXJ62718.1 ribosomal protein L28e [Cladophialophora yegresii CBS 114405]
MSERPNISADLIWEVVRNNNAYLVKSKQHGGFQFSRDPFNLTNKHSRTHAGFVNDKAVSIQPGESGAVTLKTKKPGKTHQPASHHNTHTYGKGTSNRKVYKNVADAVGKNSYRGDLNSYAVARASAIKDSQRSKKDTPEKKPRGLQGRKTVAA